MNLFARIVATGFFSGYAPKAPGTAGSLLGALLYWLIPGANSPAFLLIIILTLLIGAWAATRIEKLSGQKDNQIIVIDEIAGIFITLFMFEKSLGWTMLAFGLFRFFDIFKFTPARQLEKIPKGWGVMLDDVVAGLYAFLSLRLIHWIYLNIS